MFKDTEKELKRLEEELLAAEEMDQEEEDLEEVYDEDYEEDFDEEYDAAPQEQVSNSWTDETQVFECIPQYRSAAENHNRAAGGAVYNADKVDRDLEDFSEEVRKPKRSGVTGLLITALLLTAGILAVVAWWLVRYWEIFR